MATKKPRVLAGIAAISVIGAAAVLSSSQRPPSDEDVKCVIGAAERNQSVTTSPPRKSTLDTADDDSIKFGEFELRDAPSTVQAQFAPKTYEIPVLSHRLSLKDGQEEWAALIDETWGKGQRTKAKLWTFDRFWSTIDKSFACFQDIEVDWDALRAQYRPEIEEGVSRGRFAAVMNRLSLALMEAHTKAIDKLVLWRTPSAPGVPLLHVGGWGRDSHFGAGLTPLPDKSLLVYKTVPAHPLGLEPGDIVLGYEGRPWSELYQELLSLGLPVTGSWGSSPVTYEHAWLMAAGLNWHLFDTIDVKKFGTGEVLHLPTSPMTGLNEKWGAPESDLSEELWITEQLGVDGVPYPDFENGHLFSWGIIEGTRIGYIYGWGWYWDAEQEFYDAVHQLMYEYDTEGLIIDFRFNMGGDMSLSDLALGLLFNQIERTIDFVERCKDTDHLGLCTVERATSFLIRGRPSSFYDKPIAVLTGPGAVGAGDQVALRLTFHPNARFFGMSTNTAFNLPAPVKLRKHWAAHFAVADAFLVSASDEDPSFESDYQERIHNTWEEHGTLPGRGIIEDEFLTHDPFPVDYPVWLTPEDVAAGRDTVVEAAMQWIMTSQE